MGQVIRNSHPSGLDFVVSNGSIRLLGSIPSNASKLKKFGRWDSSNVIPRSQWYPVNNRAKFPWILDQGGLGACVGNGSAGALRRARVQAGMSDVELSPGVVYSNIDGGRDDGARPADALQFLKETGTTTFATVGQEWQARNLPSGWEKEAARFRIDEALTVSTFDELVSGMLMGWIPVWCFQVGNSFENFDAEGVCGVDRGPGNHCVHGDGLYQTKSGVWVLDTVNSWGASWGPFRNGRCYMRQESLDGGGNQQDAFLVQASALDPNEPNKPPVAA